MVYVPELFPAPLAAKNPVYPADAVFRCPYITSTPR
jgi:hypothetical protein